MTTSTLPRVTLSLGDGADAAAFGYFVIPEALARGIQALCRAYVEGDAAALAILPNDSARLSVGVRFAEWLDGEVTYPGDLQGDVPTGYQAVADAIDAIERGRCPVPAPLVRERRQAASWGQPSREPQRWDDMDDDIPF